MEPGRFKAKREHFACVFTNASRRLRWVAARWKTVIPKSVLDTLPALSSHDGFLCSQKSVFIQEAELPAPGVNPSQSQALPFPFASNWLEMCL